MTELPWGAVGDLAEQLVLIAADLIVAANDDGSDVVRGALLRVQAVEAPPELAGTPGGVWGAFAVVLAGMIDPDTPLSQLLAWTEKLYPDTGDRRLSPVQ